MMMERIDELGTWRYDFSMNTLLMTTFISFFTLIEFFPRFGLLRNLESIRTGDSGEIVHRKELALVTFALDDVPISDCLDSACRYPNHFILLYTQCWNVSLATTNMPSLPLRDSGLSLEIWHRRDSGFSIAGSPLVISQEQKPGFELKEESNKNPALPNTMRGRDTTPCQEQKTAKGCCYFRSTIVVTGWRARFRED